MKSLRLIGLGLFVMGMWGCSATGPKFTQSQLKNDQGALLYVYRQDAFCLGGRSPDIHLDSKLVSALSNNGYLSIETTPGVHLVEAKGLFDLPNTSLKINVTAGESHFVKWVPECGLLSWKLQLQQVNESRGMLEIVNTKAQN